MIGSTFRRINVEEIRNLIVAFPPREEQISIASALDLSTMKDEAILSNAASAIALLLERRGALISAAVTGKIDVRGLAPAESEAA